MKLTATPAWLTVLLTMTIGLKPELQQLIQKDIQRGAYQGAEQFVEWAIQRLHDGEDCGGKAKTRFSKRLAAAWPSLIA